MHFQTAFLSFTLFLLLFILLFFSCFVSGFACSLAIFLTITPIFFKRISFSLSSFSRAVGKSFACLDRKSRSSPIKGKSCPSLSASTRSTFFSICPRTVEDYIYKVSLHKLSPVRINHKHFLQHLPFLHNMKVFTTNNEAERLLRKYKRKQAHAVSFRSQSSIDHLCQCMGMLVMMR